MGEKLKNPPLVEALCEFRFAENTTWDWIVPGQLYDRIQTDFPERSQIQSVGFQFPASPNINSVASIHQLPGRVQLKRADGSAMVQVGHNLLAINQLKPYPSWEEFSSLILSILEEYRKVVGNLVLERIGLRYINHLIVPDQLAAISDMITLTPPLSGSLARPIRSFYQRYETEQDNPKGLLIHQTGTQQDEQANPVFVLDLDFGSTQVQGLKSAQDVKAWLDLAHERLYEAFIASLNPKLYAEFKG
ncbi:MAG: TIGR04255 family protein [Chloroflexota bacterium]